MLKTMAECQAGIGSPSGVAVHVFTLRNKRTGCGGGAFCVANLTWHNCAWQTVWLLYTPVKNGERFSATRTQNRACLTALGAVYTHSVDWATGTRTGEGPPETENVKKPNNTETAKNHLEKLRCCDVFFMQ